MTPIFDETSDAFQDLPDDLKASLRAYASSRNISDLDRVIYAVLNDLDSDIQADKLTDDTQFIEDLDLDSLAIAEFVFFFEDIFRIRITNDDLARMKTLGELKEYLMDSLGTRSNVH